MKIPAVALAAAFGGGIVLGLQPQIGSHINTRLFLMPAILGFAAVVWLAACVAERPLADDHVLRRIAPGTPKRARCIVAPTLELNAPLRWHGRLRSAPARLPWGYGLEIDLRGRMRRAN